MGVRAQSYEPGQVRLALDWAPDLCTGGELLHGGIVMALAETRDLNGRLVVKTLATQAVL
jgi:acyl-coenzyme A thioesterase PaaI-like protein